VLLFIVFDVNLLGNTDAEGKTYALRPKPLKSVQFKATSYRGRFHHKTEIYIKLQMFHGLSGFKTKITFG
jgi:hypothetical protein